MPHHSDFLRQILVIEQAQARPLRELALDPTDAAAKARLAALESRVASLRQGMAEIDTSPVEGPAVTVVNPQSPQE